MRRLPALLLSVWLLILGLTPTVGAVPVPTADFAVYLPLVANPSPRGPNVVVNGDFEAGRTGWTEVEDSIWFDFPLIVHRNELPRGTTVTPYDGAWLAWLGGDSHLRAYIEQEITLPSASPELVYWHWIESIWACDAAYGGAYLDDTPVDQYGLCAAADTGGWAKRTVDLSAYAGQTVRLRFLSQTAEDFSNLYIDAVSVHSAP